MFSRFHHRRGASNSTPTSPLPPGSEQLTAWEAAALHEKQQQQAQPHSQSYQHHRSPSSSSTGTNATTTTAAAAATAAATTSSTTAISNMPPSLPPIARVASVMTVSSDRGYDFLNEPPSDTNAAPAGASYSAPPSSLDTRRPPPLTARSTPLFSSPPLAAEPMPPSQPGESGFIGGVALANLRRQGAQDLSTAAAAAATRTAAASRQAVGQQGARAAAPTTTTSPHMAAVSPVPNTMASPPMYGTPERRMSRSKPPPPPINTNLASRQYLSVQPAADQSRDPRSAGGSRSASSFVTPTDLQSSAAAAAAAAASAVNAANEAAAAANVRTKKSRPFLMKNPVSSLLGRRKTAQSAADLGSLPINNTEAPVYAPIRGTRVHDFSAPRPRRVVNPSDSSSGTTTAAQAAAAAIAASSTAGHAPSTTSSSSAPTQTTDDSFRPRQRSVRDNTTSEPQHQPQQQPSSFPSSRSSSVALDAAQAPAPTAYSKQPADPRVPMHMPSQRTLQTLQTLQENRQLSFDEKPLPDRPITQDSARNSAVTDAPPSVRTASTRSRAASADVASLLKSSPSTGTTRSRNLSLSDISPNSNAAGGGPSTSATTPASAVAVVPKHMKSTSSRFSFMIGSASEEKLLEERHRQKQLEKKSGNPDEDATDEAGPRDSRFDDFGDDDFDYDAMMDDDGLEERIPGVNADADEEEDYHLYEEEVPYTGEEEVPYTMEEEVPEVGLDDDDSHYEEPTATAIATAGVGTKTDEPLVVNVVPEDDDPEGLDPNNDQENFAGFVFQRSNPASSLVSPSTAGMAATPRDANGRVIGFALTKDTTPDLHPPSASSLSPLDVHHNADIMAMMNKRASYDGKLAAHAEADMSGLGIQHLSAVEEHEVEQSPERAEYDVQGEQYEMHGTAESTVTIQPLQWKQPEQSSIGEHHLPSAGFSPAEQNLHEDDLYFDQGLSDELDFGNPETSGVPFDESIFDNNDTDEYGRPIPGAFARAQAAQRAAMAAAIAAAAGSSASLKRESDVPSSQMSEKSQLTESTAHTSMSVAGLPYGGTIPLSADKLEGQEKLEGVSANPPMPLLASQFALGNRQPHEDSLTALRRQLPPIMTDAERVAAYQAALAEAAYRAAASGKFRRDSSPPPLSPSLANTAAANAADSDQGPSVGLGLGLNLDNSAIGDVSSGGLESSSPTGASAAAAASATGNNAMPEPHAHLAYAFTSQSDLDYHYDLDDINDGDFDDYKQDMDDYDFDDEAIIAEANAEALANDQDGFYGQEFNFYSAPAHTSNASGPASMKGDQVVQYANGGYFIPAGALGRSTSGRVVSREPNLTPITERSEYSNRNSVLSLAVPPGLGSSGEMRSPGLAQLALLAADDNSTSDMTLQALMRLRSKTFGGGSQASLSSSREGSPMLLTSRELQERGDRDNAGSPWGFGGSAYGGSVSGSASQYLSSQQAHHVRANSATGFSSRGAAAGESSSGFASSEAGSDCGSPTLTNALPTTNFPILQPPLPTTTLPAVSPIPQLVPPASLGPMSSASSCPPVLEEQEGDGDEDVVNNYEHDDYGYDYDEATGPPSTSDVAPPTGGSSLSGSGLWMRGPGSGSEKFMQPPQLNFPNQPQPQLSMQVIPPLQIPSQQTFVASPSSPEPPIPARSSRRPGLGHRHKGSADSISYVKEEESGSGETRWVMERRRLAPETGEVELLEREVVEGI